MQKKRKKVIKYILLTLGFGILLFLSYFVYTLYTYIFWFGLEDRVVHNYQLVIDGIVVYSKQNDSLPLNTTAPHDYELS
jgi:hypothetical protein